MINRLPEKIKFLLLSCRNPSFSLFCGSLYIYNGRYFAITLQKTTSVNHSTNSKLFTLHKNFTTSTSQILLIHLKCATWQFFFLCLVKNTIHPFVCITIIVITHNEKHETSQGRAIAWDFLLTSSYVQDESQERWKKELDRLTYFYYVVWIQIYNKQSHQGSSQRYVFISTGFTKG